MCWWLVLPVSSIVHCSSSMHYLYTKMTWFLNTETEYRFLKTFLLFCIQRINNLVIPHLTNPRHNFNLTPLPQSAYQTTGITFLCLKLVQCK